MDKTEKTGYVTLNINQSWEHNLIWNVFNVKNIAKFQETQLMYNYISNTRHEYYHYELFIIPKIFK